MNLIKCIQTNSRWYKGAERGGRPVGILWHDTDAGNPYLKRYVQPFETDENYEEMIELLGKNEYGNDWNHSDRKAGMNAWIGKLADGSIATIQTGDWDMHPWGCGTGELGSLNGKIINETTEEYVEPFWIQFEICDDGYKSKEYFEKVYQEAIELTAYLCEMFDIDPFGSVEFNGIRVPTITCHYESYKLNLGNNHSDVYQWFPKMGLEKNMEKVKNDVWALLEAKKKKTVLNFSFDGEVIPGNIEINDQVNSVKVSFNSSPGVFNVYVNNEESSSGSLYLGLIDEVPELLINKEFDYIVSCNEWMSSDGFAGKQELNFELGYKKKEEIEEPVVEKPVIEDEVQIENEVVTSDNMALITKIIKLLGELLMKFISFIRKK